MQQEHPEHTASQGVASGIRPAGSSHTSELLSSAPAAAAASCPHQLLRLVIWFHHIKSTQKRKDLVGWARELDIGGSQHRLDAAPGLAPNSRAVESRRKAQWGNCMPAAAVVTLQQLLKATG